MCTLYNGEPHTMTLRELFDIDDGLRGVYVRTRSFLKDLIKFTCCVCTDEKNEIPSKKCVHHKKHSDKICTVCDKDQKKCPLCNTPYV